MIVSNLKEGDCFYKCNDKRKYHIVSILDKEDTPQIVYKFFGINRKRWFYEIESVYGFNVQFECNLYSKERL